MSVDQKSKKIPTASHGSQQQITHFDSKKLKIDSIFGLSQKKQLAPKTKTTKAAKMDDGAFFVKMDARVNKEKPFTDPDFDYYALIDFMGSTVKSKL